ncbi:MAG: hypothetical protein HQL85_18865 [Magnetococcales bacterium]|nr:hypothetical protein [Magnetococcales bacterium]
MTNHVHLIVVPKVADGLCLPIGEAHRCFTRHINFRMKWRGHLWQVRFAPFPLEDAYLVPPLLPLLFHGERIFQIPPRQHVKMPPVQDRDDHVRGEQSQGNSAGGLRGHNASDTYCHKSNWSGTTDLALTINRLKVGLNGRSS